LQVCYVVYIKPHLEIISYVYYRQNITQTSFILEFLITQQKKKILLRNQRPSQELSSKTVNKSANKEKSIEKNENSDRNNKKI
jgi:hypothetical protein